MQTPQPTVFFLCRRERVPGTCGLMGTVFVELFTFDVLMEPEAGHLPNGTAVLSLSGSEAAS